VGPDRRLYGDYSDLLREGEDAELLEVVRGLETVYAPARPPEWLSELPMRALEGRAPEAAPPVASRHGERRWATGLWARLMGGGRSFYPGRPAALPPRRAAGAAGLVALALIVGAIVTGLSLTLPGLGDVQRGGKDSGLRAGVAASPGTSSLQRGAGDRPPAPSDAGLAATEQAFRVNGIPERIVTGGLARDVKISREAGGFVVSVRKVYADPNRILLGYTISGPRGRAFRAITAWGRYDDRPARRVAQAPILTDARGRELPGASGEAPAEAPGLAAYMLSYDATGLEAAGGRVPVRLRIGKLTALEIRRAREPREVVIQGPLVFDLVIPVTRGRVSEPRRSVEAGGRTATLERAVSAPTGIRVWLRGAGPDAEVTLRVGGEEYRLAPPEGQATPSRWAPNSRWEYVTGALRGEERGPWTLLVRPRVEAPEGAGPSTFGHPGGPWEFRLAVP
jgi:hypothetical protein